MQESKDKKNIPGLILGDAFLRLYLGNWAETWERRDRMDRGVKFTERIVLFGILFWAASSAQATLVYDDFGRPSKAAPPIELWETPLIAREHFRPAHRALAAGLASLALLGFGTLGYAWYCKRAVTLDLSARKSGTIRSARNGPCDGTTPCYTVRWPG
jgi:hypothetical protein